MAGCGCGHGQGCGHCSSRDRRGQGCGHGNQGGGDVVDDGLDDIDVIGEGGNIDGTEGEV